MAGLRPAGSHCENSGSSDGSGASARSEACKNSAVFCARSASAGGGTRYFSPCLIFGAFGSSQKAQKKSEIDSLFLWESSVPLIGCFLRGADLPPLSPKGGAKVSAGRKKSGTGRRLAPKTLRGRARARVFDGAASARSSSRFFAMRSLLCAPRNHDLFRIIPLYSFSRPSACPIACKTNGVEHNRTPPLIVSSGNPLFQRRPELVTAPNRGARAYSRRPSPQLSDRCGRRGARPDSVTLSAAADGT